MEFLNLFEQFSQAGRLLGAGTEQAFADIPWTAHPDFAGVELKQLVSARQTGGQCSFHLVRIAPNQRIGRHVHARQLETHEVIAGSGVCECGGSRLPYAPGVVAIMPPDVPHQVSAGPDGLYLLAKFMPAQA